MTFSEFENLVSKIEKIELPGQGSHFQMAPLERIKTLDEVEINKKKPKSAGVMVLFYPNAKGEAMLVLMLRKAYEGVHSGQISLPGGRREESDASMEEAALRETHEEIGVPPEKIQILKSLTKLYIPPSNYWVFPFLGIARETPKFIPQDSEVEAIIEISLKDFLNDDFLSEKTLTTSYADNITVPAFLFEEYVVWGATGMVLNEVKTMLNAIPEISGK
jgi:8-oxo-dGTP pyrophosphatase MutT (NUDIX family)